MADCSNLHKMWTWVQAKIQGSTNSLCPPISTSQQRTIFEVCLMLRYRISSETSRRRHKMLPSFSTAVTLDAWREIRVTVMKLALETSKCNNKIYLSR